MELFPKASEHKNGNGLYPLHIACLYSKTEDLIMKLIDSFPNAVNESPKEASALHYACNNNNLSETVISKLTDINPKPIQEKDANGRYPIHCAIHKYQSIGVIQLLLDNDPIWMFRIEESRHFLGKTPLHLACV